MEFSIPGTKKKVPQKESEFVKFKNTCPFLPVIENAKIINNDIVESEWLKIKKTQTKTKKQKSRKF